MNVAIIIATYGDESWAKLAQERALPSAMGQGAYDVLCAHHRTGPIAVARNILAEETEADWLCYLDGDDELAPGYLDAMKRAAERQGDGPCLLTPADNEVESKDPACSGRARRGTARRGVAGQSGASVPLLLTPRVSYLRKGGRDGKKYRASEPAFLDRGIPLTDDNWLVVGTLIQRDFFMEIGGFSDYEHGFEDFSCWSKAWRAGARVVKVPDAIYLAHVNPQSKHKQNWRNRKWQVAYHEKVIAELDEWERNYKAARA